MSKSWKSPDIAAAARDVFKSLAKEAAEAAVTFRRAVVQAIRPTEIDVEFVDEPGNTFTVGDLQAVRPRAAGQQVEIRVTNGTDFSLSRVFGDSVLVGVTTPDVLTPTGAPTPVVTVASDGAASVTWDALEGASDYDVQWAKEPDFAVVTGTASTSATQYLITSLGTSSNALYVRVRGKNLAGAGPWSAAASPAAPPQAIGLTATSSNRSLSISWDPTPGSSTYELHRALDATFTNPVVVTVSGTNFVVNNLIADQTWYLRVRAIGTAEDGPWSATISVTVVTDAPVPETPTAPQGLTLTSRPKEITATWQPVDGADKYELQRGDSNLFQAPVIAEVDGTQYTASELQPAMEYFFRVRGINAAGAGPWSATASKQVVLASEYTDGAAPENSPPVTVDPSIKMLTARWPAAANADPVTYEVHISTTSGFLPGATTLLGETQNNAWVTTKLPDGSPLVIDTLYFMRVVAKDRDGAAAPGAQGSGAPLGINLGEAGDVPSGMVTGDGIVPDKPAPPSLISGIGYIYASWTRPASADPIERYEVHISDAGATFVPDANTLSLVTGALFGFIRKQGPGALNAPLVYGTTYYVKLIAIDVDGVSVPSDAASGFTVQTSAPDIAAGAVVASKIYSGDIMADRIQAGNIATDAITARTIYSGTVMADRIQASNIATGAITAASAILADAVITTAKIDNLAVTDAKIGSISAGKITTDILYATLTVSGVIRTSASTQRVEMNSGGIFAWNSAGTVLFELNASNGNAYFRGNIYAVSGTFTGDITSSATITGGTIRSAVTGDRVEIGPAVAQDDVGMGGGGGTVYYPGTAYYGGITGKIYATASSFVVSGGGAYVSMGNTTSVYGYSLYLRAANSLDYGVRSVGAPLIGEQGIFEYNGNYHRVYSPLNPPPTQPTHSHTTNENISGSWLSDGILYIRGSGDANHTLRYNTFGGAGYDGPDLRGHGHIGFIVNTYSSTVYHSRMDSAQLIVRGTSYASLREGKDEIAPLTAAEDDLKTKLRKLRPVKFKRKDLAHVPTAADRIHVGLVAEEVAEAFPELAGYDADTGELIGVQYHLLAVPMLEQMQALMTEVENLQAQVAALTPNKPA